ncbi:MAG: sugar ABC transporter permease [Endomicrobiales bacterium]|nr:sugar ABC transporter permease [Endomicrobiales bacterium]
MPLINFFRKYFTSYLFILPAVSMFVVFSIYPFYKVFALSVYHWDGISSAMKFVGLDQYRHILTQNPNFWTAMANAAYITVLALILQNGLALLLALLVNREIRGDNIYRAIFFLPPVLSGIVVGLVWKWIYDGNYGILNHFLISMGWNDLQNFAWLAEIKTSLTAVAVVHMWKGFGYGFIIMLAGLQTIPNELYEAAKVDGADAWQQFKYITVPSMISVFGLVSILTVLGTMQIFDLIYSMTRGGPAGHTHVPITRIYEYMANGEFGYASAMSVIFGMILFFVSILQLKFSRKMKQL